MTFLQTKNWICFFWHFCHFHTFASIELNFHYFRKRTKMLFPTFQGLSIDILHAKITPFLRILKMYLVAEKVRFPSFFSLTVGKIWSKLIKCMCNNIFYRDLTFKIHRFQRYSVKSTKVQFSRDTLYFLDFFWVFISIFHLCLFA